MSRSDPARARRSAAPFQSFLLAVVHNRANSHLRSEAARRSRNERWQNGQIRSEASDETADVVADVDLYAHLMHAANKRWADQPKIAKTCELLLLGHTITEIAKHLDTDPRQVRRHRDAIRSWLHHKLAGWRGAI